MVSTGEPTETWTFEESQHMVLLAALLTLYPDSFSFYFPPFFFFAYFDTVFTDHGSVGCSVDTVSF